MEWTWSRNYGCNTPAASENLLTFRSGAAGYYDLCNDGGTGNLGGFRSSCTNNLIVADGLLTAPDYTRTCTCSYQNQASLALVPMPDAEEWTFFPPREVKGVVQSVGINLGAPGNRKADDGTLWLEYPPVGGTDERPAVAVSPNGWTGSAATRRRWQGDGPAWVGASGGKGLRSLTLTLSRDAGPGRLYRVRLWFMEPDDLRGGAACSTWRCKARRCCGNSSRSARRAGVNRIVRRDYRGVRAGRDLTVTLTPAGRTRRGPAAVRRRGGGGGMVSTTADRSAASWRRCCCSWLPERCRPAPATCRSTATPWNTGSRTRIR